MPFIKIVDGVLLNLIISNCSELSPHSMEMKDRDLIRNSMRILTEHYQNSDCLLKSCCTPDFVWVNAHKNSGRNTQTEKKKSVQQKETGIPRYSLRNIRLIACRKSRLVSVVILQYRKDIWRKGSHADTKLEQMQLVWIRPSASQAPCPAEKKWKVFLINITNLSAQSDENPSKIPESSDVNTSFRNAPFTPVQPGNLSVNESGREPALPHSLQIHVHGHGIRLLDPPSVIWIESNGIHSLIHTTLENIHASESVHTLEERCRPFLFRPHSSYLINPAYIVAIRRFEIELTDGARIPVPQRKYTQIKQFLAEQIGSGLAASQP